MTSKDLGIKIGTPLQAMWNRVVVESKIEIKVLKESLIIQTAMLKMAEDKLKKCT